MKIRLTQPGFEKYNGQMGLLDFVEGLSIGDVTQMQAVRLGAVMLVEWEGGGNPSVTQSILDNSNTAAPVFSSENDGLSHDIAAGALAGAAITSLLPAVDVARFSREQLEAIADKDGITGLRDIADPRNIKSNSIKELIEAILKAS